MDVPAPPDAIDATWLDAALRGTPAFAGSSITGVRAETIGVGYGLDGALARLHLETEGGSPPASIVAKCADAERGRAEIDFYERIAPRMPIRLPRFHAGRADGGAGRAVLLLEDLSDALQGDAVQGASRVQAEAVLRAMAVFHAAFEGEASDALPLPPWEGRAEVHVERAVSRMPRFLERYGSDLDAATRRLLDDLPRLVPAAVEVLAAAPRTLVHTDLHLDNVLFVDGTEPVILDWPHARRGPAVLDVTRLLLEGMTPEGLRRNGQALLAAYTEARAGADRPWVDAVGAAAEVRSAVIWHLARTVSWAGAEDPGFGTPRVKAIVDMLVWTAVAAVGTLLEGHPGG